MSVTIAYAGAFSTLGDWKSNKDITPGLRLVRWRLETALSYQPVTTTGRSASIPAMSDHPLDTKGLQCPLPVLRARKAMKAIAVGDTLTVEATDPGSRKDFPAFCDATGNRLLSVEEVGGVLRFVIERLV
ncbi:sulfurtransferase TusA family protein [Azospirillum thiophilum]